MSEITELNETLGGLLKEMREAKAREVAGDGREAEAAAAKAKIAEEATAAQRAVQDAENAASKASIKTMLDEMIADGVKAQLRNSRMPSLAAAIGQGASNEGDGKGRMVLTGPEPDRSLKAAFRDYQAGEFMTALLDFKGIGRGGIDVEAAMRGKAQLDALGLVWAGVPEYSKATLGATGATGGYVLPNNLVATLEKPNTQEAVYTGANPLVTVINGVAVRGVDQPYRTGAPARMQFSNWGDTKENTDEAYGNYSAVLGTVARIYDIGKQYARFSAGAAEQDVMDELRKAAALAENYYTMAGAGTGNVGSGDPTTGVYTALMAGPATFRTAFAAASNSTVAGSVAAALAGAHGVMATRSRRPSAAVLDAVTYWDLFSQGSDSAGFWMSQLLGAGFRVGADNQLSWNGTPLMFDANLTANTAAKLMVLGEWKALKFYRGTEFRIDTSDVAGDRWDNNLIGFRGEEEIGINASTACAVGAFQLVTAIVP